MINKKEETMKDIKIGDKVTVQFTFEVDGIRKNNHKDGELTLTGWIKEGEKCVELVAIPLSCVVSQ
jgi:hypothetical protein